MVESMNLASSVAVSRCCCNLELHGKQTSLSVSEHKKHLSHKCIFKAQGMQKVTFFCLEAARDFFRRRSTHWNFFEEL